MNPEYVHPDLHALCVEISTLSEDPKNARSHDHTGIKAVASSLERFGQRIPLVVRNGFVISGNARLRAAKSLGWTHIAVVNTDTDDDARSTLWGLVDNKVGDLSTFDSAALSEALASLADTVEQAEDLMDFGWTDSELNNLLDIDLGLDEEPTKKEPKVWERDERMDYTFKIVIDCDSEEHQAEQFQRLVEEGLSCRMLMS